MEKIQNNFAGMDLDTNPEKFNSNYYSEAYNVRIGSNIGIEVSGVGENPKGSLEGIKNIVGTLKNLFIADSEFEILSLVRIRDHIAFIADLTSTQAIYYIAESDLNNTTAFTPFYSWAKTSLTLDGSKLQMLGRYETPNLIKLYFTDGNGYIKSVNLVGTPPNSVIELEMFKPVNMSSSPSFTVSDGGSIKCGNVCYALQYYSLNGGVTNYIPVGPLVPLLKGSSTDTKTLMGGTSEEYSNRKCTITIPSLTVSNGLNYVKVVRILYTLIENVPSISVVYNGTIASTGDTVVTDTGQVLETIAAEKFALNTNPIGCSTLEQKNNILFLGNILQNEFDVTYDARARRYNSLGVAYSGDLNPWNDTTVTNYTTDNSFQFASDTNVVGGTGTNASYSFEREYIKIFDTSTKTCVNSENIVKKCFQRGEIYGFSLIGFDEYMRPSYAKFIDDIRIPRFNDPELVNTSLEPIKAIMRDNTGTLSSEKYVALYPQFSFSNLPANIKYVAVARTSREGGEGTIADTGLMCPLYKYGTDPMSASAPTDSGTKAMRMFPLSKGDYFEVVTPKVLINNNLPTFDRIEYTYNASLGGILNGVAEQFASTRDADSDGNPYLTEYFRYSGTPLRIGTTSILDKKMYTFSNVKAGEFNIGGDTVRTIATLEGYAGRGGYKSRCMYVNFSSRVTDPPASGDAPFLMPCTLKRNNYPYGGYTTSAIEQRNWLLSSSIVPVSNGNASVHTIGFGDTYVQMMPYTRVLWDAYNSNFDRDFGNTSYIPIESQILMKGIVGKNFDAYHGATDNVATQPYKLLQELKGVYIDYKGATIVDSFTQESDLYSYNSAYSSDNKSKIYITKPSIYNSQSVFDTRVAYSSRKINGEVIDSWGDFLSSNYKELDTSRGALTKLINLNNILFFVQQSGAGTLAVDERELINSTENAGALYLGTGGVLARYDYIYTNYGAKSLDSVDNTNNYIYFYDRIAGKFCRMNSQSAEILTDVKNCKTYFSKVLWDDKNIVDYMVGCDNIRQQIYFKPTGSTKGIVFNELWNEFDSFTNIPFSKAFSTENVFYFTTSKTTGNIGKFLYSLSQNPSVDSIEGLDELEHSLSKNVTLIGAMAIPARLDLVEWTSEVYSSNNSIGLTEQMEVYRDKDLFLTFSENEDSPSPRYFNRKRYNRMYNVITRERCKGNFFKIKYIGNPDINKKANFTLNTFNMYVTPIVSR